MYIAFKRIKNFASVEVHANQDRLVVYVEVDPDLIALQDEFTRDVGEIGHWGTGDLEISLRNMDNLKKATSLFEKCYQAS